MKKLKFNDSFKTETKNSNEILVKVVRGREALLVYLLIISTVHIWFAPSASYAGLSVMKMAASSDL